MKGLHYLALELHKTVGELLDTMTMAEYHDWVEYFREENEDAERRRARARGEIRLDAPNAGAQLLAAIGKVPPLPKPPEKAPGSPQEPRDG